MQIPYGGATTNSGNAYSIATPAISALTAGMAISIKINADSTGATTLNWNSKGAKAIKKANGTDATSLKANGIYTLRYDGTNFILQGEGGSGTAIASHLLSGDTASTDAGDIVGTMVNNGVTTITPTSSDQAISGYYASGSKILGANLKQDIELYINNLPSGYNPIGIFDDEGCWCVNNNGTDGKAYLINKAGTIIQTITYNNNSSQTMCISKNYCFQLDLISSINTFLYSKNGTLIGSFTNIGCAQATINESIDRIFIFNGSSVYSYTLSSKTQKGYFGTNDVKAILNSKNGAIVILSGNNLRLTNNDCTLQKPGWTSILRNSL